MKIYCVWAVPHGDLTAFVGVFSTEEKADKARERWINENPKRYYKPHVEEFELDEYLSELS